MASNINQTLWIRLILALLILTGLAPTAYGAIPIMQTQANIMVEITLQASHTYTAI